MHEIGVHLKVVMFMAVTLCSILNYGGGFAPKIEILCFLSYCVTDNPVVAPSGGPASGIETLSDTAPLRVKTSSPLTGAMD